MKVFGSVGFESLKMKLTWVLTVIFLINSVLSLKYEQRDNGSKILFPGETQSREIPLDLIRRLNSLSSMEEFFNNMLDTDNLDLTDRMAVDTTQERGPWRGGMIGKCIPEYTTIPIKPNQSTTSFYYPRCVRVKRCGGCCLHDLFTCRPTETEVIPLTVAVAEYRGGHQFHLKEQKTIQIEQHKKCECGCKIQPKDCTKYQKYNAENCRCECPNSEEERKCHNKIWNPDICSCICRDELTCGTGFEFDPFSCRCTPARGRRKTGFVYRLIV